MHRVTVDAAVKQELCRAKTVAEICDSSGRVIGYFRPRHVPQHLLDYDDILVDELLDRGRQRSGRLFSAVIADCESTASGNDG